MKTISFLLLLLLLASEGYAQEYYLKKDVMGNGSNSSSVLNIKFASTIGQPASGSISSSGFMIRSGFWAGGVISGLCDYIVGDVNGSHSYNGFDITYGVSFFKGGPLPLYECECGQTGTWYVSGDVNGSCNYNGLDITYGVAYFKGGPAPVPCPSCPPE